MHARRAGRVISNDDISRSSRLVRPFIRDVETQERWALNLIYDRLEDHRQVMVRGLAFVDGADLFTAQFFASYRIDLVGWIHPS